MASETGNKFVAEIQIGGNCFCGKTFPLRSGFLFCVLPVLLVEFQRRLESPDRGLATVQLRTVALREVPCPLGLLFPNRDGYFTTQLSLKIFSRRSVRFSKRSLSLSRSVVRSSADCFQTQSIRKKFSLTSS